MGGQAKANKTGVEGWLLRLAAESDSERFIALGHQMLDAVPVGDLEALVRRMLDVAPWNRRRGFA